VAVHLSQRDAGRRDQQVAPARPPMRNNEASACSPRPDADRPVSRRQPRSLGRRAKACRAAAPARPGGVATVVPGAPHGAAVRARGGRDPEGSAGGIVGRLVGCSSGVSVR
jgi:hypothetical protein